MSVFEVKDRDLRRYIKLDKVKSDFAEAISTSVGEYPDDVQWFVVHGKKVKTLALRIRRRNGARTIPMLKGLRNDAETYAAFAAFIESAGPYPA